MKTIAVIILILGVSGLVIGAVMMRLRKPYSEKLALMGGIFDFGPRVRGVFPPYVEGMAGPFCTRYQLLPGKKMKGIAGARVVIPVDAQVRWKFSKKEIREADPEVFGISTDAFAALGQMPDCMEVELAGGKLTARFSGEKAGGEKGLMDMKAARKRVQAVSVLAKSLGCMARM